MSKGKTKKKSHWGGSRNGAGRPKGSGQKEKICVSVNRDNWQAALQRWKKKGSWLVDSLITDFVNQSHIPTS